MKEIEFVNCMIIKLKSLKSAIKKKEKLTAKSFEMNYTKNSERQMQKVNTDLNCTCMNIHKTKIDIARDFKGSILDVEIEKRNYNLSKFHNYKG